MSLPIESKPLILVKQLNYYKNFFSKRQFEHFKRLIIGLIVSKNTTLQEINDLFCETNQSSLNRFVSHSKFDLNDLNRLRLSQVNDKISFREKGILIIDESLKHKTGREMELAGFHRSGITKKIEWGHMVVNSLYSDLENNIFPVSSELYVREVDCEKDNIKFKTKREIGIEQIDFALQNNLPIKLVLADAGYDGVEFLNSVIKRGLDFCIGVRTSTKISVNRQKRTNIAKYLENFGFEKNHKKLKFKSKIYEYHTVNISVRKIGKLKLVISKIQGDDELKCYFTNLKIDDMDIIKILTKRWEIESFHRDTKQHLGFESYQVRKGRGMQVVALAILTAYTQIFLAKKQISKKLTLTSIGEYCRYFALIAYKGLRWIKRQLNKGITWFKQILKRHVLIKTAKA